MKDSKKKTILTTAAGMAVGVAGTVGATELHDYLKDDGNTQDEELGNVVQEPEKPEPEKPQETNHHQTAQPSHLDVGEVVPVASETVTVEVHPTGDNTQAVLDVDPDEVAEAIVEEAEDPEVLLAMNEGKDDEDGEDEDVDDDDIMDDDIDDDVDDDNLPDIEESIV